MTTLARSEHVMKSRSGRKELEAGDQTSDSKGVKLPRLEILFSAVIDLVFLFGYPRLSLTPQLERRCGTAETGIDWLPTDATVSVSIRACQAADASA